MAIRYFLVVLLLTIIGCGNTVDEGNTAAENIRRADNIKRAVKRLDAYSRWMIENGIAEILTNSAYAEKFHRLMMLDEFASSFHTKPGLKNEDELARFVVKSYTIYYDINLLKRSDYDGSIYEYWMIFTSSQSFPEYHEDCQFFITKSDNIKSRRTIVKESGQFFHQYTEGSAVAISLDYKNDLYIRHKLGAWIVPHCYKHYAHITQNKIIPIGNGKYSFAP